MSFTIDGTPASALNVKLKSDYQEPGSPDIRKKEMEIPGRAGKLDYGSEYDVRVFELPLLTLNTTTKAGVQAVIRNIAALLTDNAGQPKTVKLSFDKESNKHYNVKLDQKFGIKRHPAHFGEFTLKLVAVEPFAYETQQTVSQNVTGSPEDIAVTNSGNVETPVKIKITNNGASAIGSFTIKQKK